MERKTDRCNWAIRPLTEADVEPYLDIYLNAYPAYKALAGAYQFGSFVLVIDHVQGDPFASPSSLHIEIPTGKTAGDEWEKGGGSAPQRLLYHTSYAEFYHFIG